MMTAVATSRAPARHLLRESADEAGRDTRPSRVRIAVDRRALARFCREHHIRRLAFFGSVLRDDFTPESDVDVLVEFEPGHVPGLAFFEMEEELGALLGRKVDLNTWECLSPYFRDEVAAEAEVQYVAA
jgi:predicted nucleotidyltransferase